jgi:hypothetical protein
MFAARLGFAICWVVDGRNPSYDNRVVPLKIGLGKMFHVGIVGEMAGSISNLFRVGGTVVLHD